MHKTILLALLLVVWNCAGAQSPQENQEVMNAALRLKQAAVLRTLEDCKAKGGSVKSCNTLLELTHQREVKIIKRLKLAPTDPAVNMDEVGKEIAACSSPNYGYVETVECWSQLSDRLDATRKGQSLLRSAGPATTVAGAPPVTPTPTPPQNRGWVVSNDEVNANIGALPGATSITVVQPEAAPAPRKGFMTEDELMGYVMPVMPAMPEPPKAQSPEDDWRHCINDLISYDNKTRHDDPLPKETLEGICRDTLHLPWYSHTPYEPTISFLSPYMGLIIVGGALVVIIGAVWVLRRWLANAAVTTAKSVDRSVFGLTGFGVARWWSGVVQRWRTP
jgi:hypothetical protein